jgi:hypothetical protein
MKIPPAANCPVAAHLPVLEGQRARSSSSVEWGLAMFAIVIFGALLVALLVAPLAARERPVAPY